MRVLAILLVLVSTSLATTTLAWDEHPDESVVGFIIYRELEAGAIRWVSVPGGKSTSAKILTVPGEQYTAHITAYNLAGLESLPSESVTWTATGEYAENQEILKFSWWLLVSFDARPGTVYRLQRWDFESGVWINDGDAVSTGFDSPILRLSFLRKRENRAMYRLFSK